MLINNMNRNAFIEGSIDKIIKSECDLIFDKTCVDTKKVILDIFLSHREMYRLGFIDKSRALGLINIYFNEIFITDSLCDDVVENIISMNITSLSQYIESIYNVTVIPPAMLDIIDRAILSLCASYNREDIIYLTSLLMIEILTNIYKHGDNNILSLLYRKLKMSIDDTVKYKPSVLSAFDFRVILRSNATLFNIVRTECTYDFKQQFVMCKSGDDFRKIINILSRINDKDKENILKCVVEI